MAHDSFAGIWVFADDQCPVHNSRKKIQANRLIATSRITGFDLGVVAGKGN
jgi:hypothetical protein